MTDGQVSFCSECGTHLESDAHFCAVCGHAVPGAAAAGAAAGAASGAAAAPLAPPPVASPPVAPPTVPVSAPAGVPAPSPVAPPAAVPPVAPTPTAGPPPVYAASAPAAAAPMAYGATAPVAPPAAPYGFNPGMPPGTPPGQPPGPAGYPIPAGAPAPRADDGNRKRTGLYILIGALAVVLVIAMVAAALVITADSSDAEEVFLEPIGYVTPEPFTESVTAKVEQPVKPATVKVAPVPSSGDAGQQVPGSQAGLYGGTTNAATCDPEKLISFLQANPDKGAAWAGVLGIATTGIPAYVRGLTPVVLTRDTRVVNHGFANGKATTIPAVLQAGTAVMVDKFGVPRVKCGCGNPLTEPAPLKAKAKFKGTEWTGFAVNTIVVVSVTVEVNTFVIVNIDTGSSFERPPGNAVDADTPIAADELCDIYPSDPSCAGATTSTTTGPGASSSTTSKPASSTTTATPTGTPETLAEVGNIGGVQSGATAPTILQLDHASHITQITTYHWNSGQGAPPGTIGLRAADRSTYGPFPATSTPGQGGVPNANWIADVSLDLPAGSYEVIDSDPGTWAQNAESGGQGFASLVGYPTEG